MNYRKSLKQREYLASSNNAARKAGAAKCHALRLASDYVAIRAFPARSNNYFVYKANRFPASFVTWNLPLSEVRILEVVKIFLRLYRLGFVFFIFSKRL